MGGCGGGTVFVLFAIVLALEVKRMDDNREGKEKGDEKEEKAWKEEL